MKIRFKELSESLKLEITSNSLSSDGNSDAVRYTISVTLSTYPNWQVKRRFSEFDHLNKKLSSWLNKQVLPFPSKLTVLPFAAWINKVDMNAVDKRHKELNVYLQEIAKIPAVLRASEFLAFIGFTEQGFTILPSFSEDESAHSEEILPPLLDFTLSDPKFGINALVYDEKRNFVICAMQDPKLISKFNSYIANAKLPWEKQPVSEIPVGCFCIWKQVSENQWDSSIVQEFVEPVSAVCWNSKEQRVFAGLENGELRVFKVSDRGDSVRSENSLKLHSLRISSMIFEESSEIIISCSRDKSVCLFDSKNNQILAQTIVADTWIMSMDLDTVNRRLFCGLASGHIIIVDITDNKISSNPSEHLLIKDHSECVRSLYYCPEVEYLFSGCFDSSSNIWKVANIKPRNYNGGKPAQIIARLRNGPSSKVKAILYLPVSFQTVVTGHDDGHLAFWNTKSGKLDLCLSNAHSDSIVVLLWIESLGTMVSGGRDGNIRFWKFKMPPSKSKAHKEEEKQ